MMYQTRLKQLCAAALISTAIFSCKKDENPIIVVPPSTGNTIVINGLAGGEAGSSAGNSVFVDLSTDKQTAVARSSYDLGFYSGTEFRVILNNTTTATAKVLAKTDLNAVGIADTIGLNKIAIGFDATSWNLVDNISGNISQTVIPAVSATDADNKVIIVNRGTGGGIAARDYYKIRILRNGSAGYKLQYAKLDATAFTTIEIAKDAQYNFKFVSFDGGAIVNVEPQKELWDFRWSYALYQTMYISTMIPYAFSDLITINTHAGVQAAEVLTSTVSYDNYAASNISGSTFSSNVYAIGSGWRSTQPATGVATDRFYVVKDPAGNAYKIKFKAMGAGDGGTRGKPEFEYKLVK